jgi:hypothetical protein
MTAPGSLKPGGDLLPRRRDRRRRKALRKEVLEARVRLLLDRAIGETPDRAMRCVAEAAGLADDQLPGWRDKLATDHPKLVPMLRQIDWSFIRARLNAASHQPPAGGTRRDRPTERRTAEKRDELAPSHGLRPQAEDHTLAYRRAGERVRGTALQERVTSLVLVADELRLHSLPNRLAAPANRISPRTDQLNTPYFLNQAIILFQASSAASLR